MRENIHFISYPITAVQAEPWHKMMQQKHYSMYKIYHRIAAVLKGAAQAGHIPQGADRAVRQHGLDIDGRT